VEGDGKKQPDGGKRPDAGQHADQRAERDPGEAVREVLRRQRDLKAEREALGDAHQKATSRYGSLSPYTNTAAAKALITSVRTTTACQRAWGPAAAASGNMASSAGTSPKRGMRKPNARIETLIQASGLQSQASGCQSRARAALTPTSAPRRMRSQPRTTG